MRTDEMINKKAKLNSMCGTNVAFNKVPHGSLAKNKVRGYASNFGIFSIDNKF